MTNSKKKQIRNTIALICAVCLSGSLTTGCGASPASADDQVVELPTPAASDSTAPSQPETAPDGTGDPSAQSGADPVQPDANSGETEGRWHVFSPDVAAAVDADFAGDIRKIEGNTFYISETKNIILEYGSLSSSSVASGVTVPDSDLIPVVYDENTHFCLRTIYNGETHEDSDASAQDLELTREVELKGSFEDDVFHASEVRILKIS